jgi:hypothetical protein
MLYYLRLYFLPTLIVPFLDLIPFKGSRTYFLGTAMIVFNLLGLILGKIDQAAATEGMLAGLGLLFAASHGEQKVAP